MNFELLNFLNNKTVYIKNLKMDFNKEIEEENKKYLFLESCGLLYIYSYTGNYKFIFDSMVEQLNDSKNKEEVFIVLAKFLNELKKVFNSHFSDPVNNQLKNYGIELTNFENFYEQLSIILISRLAKKEIEEINWWLYEDVEKIYYVDEKQYNVEKALDFLNFKP
tara:strand:+ start:38083 stop:38577 length:495 start_codon:yes stop_codon:yes gene_type:complete